MPLPLPNRGSTVRGLFLLAMLSWPRAALEAAPPRFVSPRHLSTAVGDTVVELALEAGEVQDVERVELRIDGELLASWTRPPWRTSWSAGDGTRGHRLEALVLFKDGSRSRAVIRTSALRIDQIEEVDLVVLYAIVRDRSGSYVEGLTIEDFRVLEDDVEQPISSLTPERKPLNVAIVLDTSLSMKERGKLERAQTAALEFLRVLQPGDRGIVVAFNDNVDIVQPLTDDVSLLASAISTREAEGGTALYDAVWRASHRLSDLDGRRVMVLLSDGRDEAQSGVEPGSLHTRAEALDRTLRNEVIVFSIGLGPRLDREYPHLWERPSDRTTPGASLAEILAAFAERSGGRALFSPGPKQLRRAFREVEDDLRNHYAISYVPLNREKDGRWRDIEVLAPQRDLEVVTRDGYYAPGSSTAD